MSFIFTHDKAIKEGRAFGVNLLKSQRAVIIGGNTKPCDDAQDPEWCQELVDKVRFAEDAEDVEKLIPGSICATNELKVAVSAAVENAGGVPVGFIAVADPDDLESWSVALSRAKGCYGIVPCTSDPDVLALVAEVVESRSKAESGAECVAWFSLETPIRGATGEPTGREEQAQAIADAAASYSSKRIRAVWPGRFRDENSVYPRWHLCAALAGLRSGCAPHRDLTGVEIAGVRGLGDVADLFEEQQLDMMAECGAWLVIERSGHAVTRQGVTTTNSTEIEEREESVVTNLDSINKTLRSTLSAAIQTTAATPKFRRRIIRKLRVKLEQITCRRVPYLGGQLRAGEVEVVRRHVYLEDSLVLNVRLKVPCASSRGFKLPTIMVNQKVIG